MMNENKKAIFPRFKNRETGKIVMIHTTKQITKDDGEVVYIHILSDGSRILASEFSEQYEYIPMFEYYVEE